MSGNEPEFARYEIAEESLKRIQAVFEEWSGSDWSLTRPSEEIAGILRVADARLRMAFGRRRLPKARWLAKVTSFSYPHERIEDWKSAENPRLCFSVEITDGAKTVQGRQIEVQMPDEDARRLAVQILDMCDARKRGAAT